MLKINTRLFLVKHLLSRQAGFSLLEAIMAVLVVSILMAAILSMSVLITASRVQARRVDLATQAARSYVDGVRSGVIDIINAPSGLSTFPFKGAMQANRNQYFSDVAAPTSATAANLFKIPGVKVDTNGEGFSLDDPDDLVIQPMRSGGDDSSTLSKQGFYMEVRVYRADAFTGSSGSESVKSGITLLQGPDANNSATCFSGSRVFTSTNGSQTCPLVIMKVDVYPTSGSTFSDIKNRL